MKRKILLLVTLFIGLTVGIYASTECQGTTKTPAKKEEVKKCCAKSEMKSCPKSTTTAPEAEKKDQTGMKSCCKEGAASTAGCCKKAGAEGCKSKGGCTSTCKNSSGTCKKQGTCTQTSTKAVK